VTGSKIAEQNTNLLAALNRANLEPVTDFRVIGSGSPVQPDPSRRSGSPRDDGAEQVVPQGSINSDRVKLARVHLSDVGIIDEAEAVDFRRL
jgi:hypothetical protein